MGKKVDKAKRLVDQVLLTPDQVVEKTGWKMGTLFSRRARGQGPPYIRIGGFVRYPEDELDKWLEQGRQEVA